MSLLAFSPTRPESNEALHPFERLLTNLSSAFTRMRPSQPPSRTPSAPGSDSGTRKRSASIPPSSMAIAITWGHSAPCVSGVVLASTLTQAYFKKGAVVPLHRHEWDVVVYVLQGALRAHVDDTDVTVREGEVLLISGDHRELNVGEVRHLAVVADRFTLMVSGVAEGYYLLLVLADSSSYGRARFELRRARLLFESDLS